MPRRDHGFGTFIQLLALRRFPAWLRYGGTLALVGAFVALRLALPIGGMRFVLFIPAVLGAALAFGPVAGFMATALTTLAALWMLIGSDGALSIPASEVLPVLIYVAIGIGLSLLCHVLRAALARATVAERSKSVLLEEMAHRTKNDLQTIAALLILQARTLPEGEGRQAVETAAARVTAVAKLHNRLRSDGQHGVVDIRDYLDDLCGDLTRPYGELRPVVVQVEAERATLATTVAAPIGLIVNELVTNAFKYAFPDNRSGTIRVDFHRRASGRGYELRVSDDGVGETDLREGLGSRLVRQLVQQLGGAMDRPGRTPGTVTIVTLPDFP